MSERTNSLKQTDIFYQLTDAQLEMVANLCQERHFSQGEMIVEEGAHTSDLFIITHGEVEVLLDPSLVSKGDGSHTMEPIARLRRGQSFGEIALVDEGLRSATVRAAEKVTQLLVIPKDRLITLCETYPQFGYRLMSNLAADLAMKIRNADLRIRESLLYARKE